MATPMVEVVFERRPILRIQVSFTHCTYSTHVLYLHVSFIRNPLLVGALHLNIEWTFDNGAHATWSPEWFFLRVQIQQRPVEVVPSSPHEVCPP